MSSTGQSNSSRSDPSSPVSGVHFWFEGRPQRGRSGDTIASALFAAGVRTLSYSVKYHRPRGVFCGRGRCSTCAVEVDGAPGIKACMTPLRDGMRVRRQEARPWFAPLLTAVARAVPFPAGFYYRFLTRPRPVREAFLGSLRRMAGVGRIDPVAGGSPAAVATEATRVEPLAARYDVVVVGAGVSGLAAAVAAAGQGASVALLDEYAWLGGHAIGALDTPAALGARDDLAAAVAASPGITVAPESLVQALYPDGTLMVARGTPSAMERVRAASVVLATGAFDTIPLFENNDLPGVFGPRALRLFLERDRLALGTRALLYGTGRDADDTAALLQAHGIAIASRVEEGRLLGVDGRDWVRSARVESAGGGSHRVACDLVCAAVTGQPDFALTQQAGFEFELDGMSGDLAVMRPTRERLERDGRRVYLVGETAGVTEWLRKIEHAAAAGRDAAQPAGSPAGRQP